MLGMARLHWLILVDVCFVGFLAGCGAKQRTDPPNDQPLTAPVIEAPAKPAIDPLALLTLDEIQPQVKLPVSPSATAPSAPAPLDAIELYARARDALHAGQRQRAADLIERAVELDPHSFELRHALGRAYLQGSWDQRSIDALHQAERLNPDSAALQTDLGRQYLAKGEWQTGVSHLRLALQASDFEEDEASAGVAELFLADALQKKGYLTAALDLYEWLRRRLSGSSFSVRMNPELYYYVVRRDQLDLRIGELHEKLGRFDEALAVYEPLAAAEPTDFEAQARVVRTLAAAQRFDDAAVRAADVIKRFRASAESLKLLHDVYRAAGREAHVADALRAVHADRPEDRSVLYALADVLIAEGKPQKALEVLEEALAQLPDDAELLGRLITLGQEIAPDPQGAARRLIVWSAKHPEAVYRLAPLWAKLVRPTAPEGLRWTALRSIQLPDEEGIEAARHYWIARTAQAARRRPIAREALRAAVQAQGRPFAPAYRGYVEVIWSSEELSDDQKEAEIESLATRAAENGDDALASEVRGLSLLSRDEFGPAETAFKQAIEQGGDSPELYFVYALALRRNGNLARFEQMLWKVVADWPQFEEAAEALYSFYQSTGADAKADTLLGAWLGADPQGVAARLRQARETFSRGRVDAAESLLLETFEDHPADPRITAVLHALYAQLNRRHRFDELLTEAHRDEPGNLGLAAALVEFKLSRGQRDDAVRVVDATRDAVADDPDALYQVSHLYLMAEQKDPAEQALRTALRLEPGHPPAANDLGYSLAEQGRNLEEAERLCRAAVNAEPHNAAFLDSLGWVLYKRERFEEAQRYLQEATGLLDTPDPVVLDHLGDTLYHLKRRDQAAALWRQSLEIIGPTDSADERDEQKQLRERLVRKLGQFEAREEIEVAPVGKNDKVRG